MTEPPPAPRPLLARLLSPPGPPEARLFTHGASAILAAPGRYCVSYLILGEDTIAIADCGSAADVAVIDHALAWLDRDPRQVRYVLPTHLHFDHMMGLDRLALHLGASIALGRVAMEHLRGRSLRWPRGLQTLRAIPTWPMQGMPFFTLEDWRRGLGYGTPWGRNRFRAALGPELRHGEPLPGLPGWTVLETPGHADDAVCLFHREAGWLVAGDTLRNFLGGEWNPLLCDRRAYRQTQDLLRSLPVRLVLPGHGPVFGVRSLAEVKPRPAWMP